MVKKKLRSRIERINEGRRKEIKRKKSKDGNSMK
jgi:hypothetical protein